jgi:hypothetical protein
MALKPDRIVTDGGTDISFFCNQINEKGAVMILSAGGSGASMDDSAALVTRPTTAYAAGEIVLGLLLNDVVSGDLTKTHLNQHKDEVQVGSKVTILRRGQVTTNLVSGTPSAGYMVYAADTTSGTICGFAISDLYTAGTTLDPVITGSIPSGAGKYTRLGTFLSSKDSDGYPKVEINLI